MRLLENAIALGLWIRSEWKFAVLMWALLTILCGIASLSVVLDNVPLGPDFCVASIVTIAGAVLAAFCLTLLLLPLSLRLKDWTPRLRRGRLSRWAFVALLGLTALSICAGLTWKAMHNSRISTDAETALQEFMVVTYGPDLERSRVNQTLAEFERARRRLEEQWAMSKESPQISVHLFRDLQEYHAGTGRTWSFGLTQCTSTGAAIFVPLEEASRAFAEDNHTRTPMHEMVYATMCQSLGSDGFVSMPLWFHEGMAELYENEGPPRRITRIENRIRVWFSQDKLMTPELILWPISWIPDYGRVTALSNRVRIRSNNRGSSWQRRP